ncbi:MAG: hypothetical protein IT437_03215 [Phycisphaerales bacterium]|nr:hypothetical protein [Phycisphaerales bacterium]
MKRSTPFIVLAACGMCASWASAHPNPKTVKGFHARPVSSRLVHAVPTVPNVIDGVFSDNFDSYADGSVLNGQGGWEGWDGSVDPFGYVSSEQSSSSPHSLRETAPSGGAAAESDVVQRFDITGGKWIFSAKHYMPATSVGISYFILLNHYPATFNWSLDLGMDNGTQLVTTIEVPDLAQFPGGVQNQVPIVRDQWVDIRCEIDLDAGTTGRLDVYYNNQLVTSGIAWAPPTGDARHLAALDLYSSGCDKVFFDDVKLEAVAAPCYPDCNGDSVLNLADFGCFTTKFALNDPYADCNGDSVLNLSDFGCFTTKFALGCP